MPPPIRPASDESDVDAVEEIVWMLWATVGLIAHRASAHDAFQVTPPISLEHELVVRAPGQPDRPADLR